MAHGCGWHVGRTYAQADIRALRLSPLVGPGVMFAVESKTDIDTTSQ
jgi:hypothetical protein